MAYQIEVTGYFSAAHQLRGYQGKCEQLHGHNWKVAVTVTAAQLDNIGLALDFTELRTILQEVLQTLDHSFLNNLPYFHEINPTSEQIARYIFERCTDRLEKKSVQVTAVSVWESETAKAVYQRKNTA